MVWYHFLDIFFLVFHTSLIIINLLGWAWKPTRIINLATLLITLLSWTVLGIFFDWGYCPVTDWHWEVLRKSGNTRLPYSYITYIINRISGFNPDESLVEIYTAIMLGISLFLSFFLNGRDYIYKRKIKKAYFAAKNG